VIICLVLVWLCGASPAPNMGVGGCWGGGGGGGGGRGDLGFSPSSFVCLWGEGPWGGARSGGGGGEGGFRGRVGGGVGGLGVAGLFE